MQRATPAEVSFATGVRIRTIQRWAQRGQIEPLGPDGCYDMASILAWMDRRNAHHAKIAENRYRTPTTHRYGATVDDRDKAEAAA